MQGVIGLLHVKLPPEFTVLPVQSVGLFCWAWVSRLHTHDRAVVAPGGESHVASSHKHAMGAGDLLVSSRSVRGHHGPECEPCRVGIHILYPGEQDMSAARPG